MQSLTTTISILTCVFLCFHSMCAQTLNGIESVEYDPINEQFLISNGSSIIAQDYATGDLSFFGSAAASHGMEVMNDTLFAIDGSRIKGYALSDGSEVMSLSITGAQFLNGLTNDGIGILYATDFGKDQILKIDVSDIGNPSFEVLVNNTQVTPNGIHYDGENNRLLFVSWGNGASVRAVDLTKNTLSTVVSTSYGNMDGIVQDNEGNYYISTWAPDRIIKFDREFANDPIEIALPTDLSNPADIGIDKENNILAIPHYPNSGDEVVYVDLNEEGEVASEEVLSLNELQLSLSPNPINTESILSYALIRQTPLTISVVDPNGKTVQTYYNGIQAQGLHEITVIRKDYIPGQYFIMFQTEQNIKSIPFLVY